MTFFLSGAGFVVTMLVRGNTSRHQHEREDTQRLNVLATQAAAVYVMAYVVDAVWGDATTGVPVVVTLAAIVTATFAAEAIVIWRRGPKSRSN